MRTVFESEFWATKRITNRSVVIFSRITNSSLKAPPHPGVSCRRSTSIQRVLAGSTCPATVSSAARTHNGTASWAPPSAPNVELFRIRHKPHSRPIWTLTKRPQVMGAHLPGTWVTQRSKASVTTMDAHCLDKARKSGTGGTWCVFSTPILLPPIADDAFHTSSPLTHSSRPYAIDCPTPG